MLSKFETKPVISYKSRVPYGLGLYALVTNAFLVYLVCSLVFHKLDKFDRTRFLPLSLFR